LRRAESPAMHDSIMADQGHGCLAGG